MAEQAIEGGPVAPNVGDVAKSVMGAMIADPRKDPDGLGWAHARRTDGSAIYLVAVVLGNENVQKAITVLDDLRSQVAPATDVFNEDGSLR